MQKNKLIVIIVIAAAIIGIGATIAYASLPKQVPSEEELPSSTILANQENLDEVRAFLIKYPDADISVDRSGRLAVDYRVDKPAGDGNSVGGEYLRLRVFSDNEGNPQEMFVDCSTQEQSPFTNHNITNYIETETCLK